MHYGRWKRHGDPAIEPHSRPKGCSIDGCERRHEARGWCQMHYFRWKTHGDPLAGNTRHATPEESFAARTEQSGDCLVWTGNKVGDGYGAIQVNGHTAGAHRYAWEREYGPIPDGKVIDHMCWERSCVNVEHLRLATPQQNVQSRRGASRNRRYDLPRGVYRNGRRYMAKVGHAGITHYLGTFPTIAEASAAAESNRVELFGAFAGGN